MKTINIGQACVCVIDKGLYFDKSRITVSWSCEGEVSIEKAKKFAKDMDTAVKTAENMQRLLNSGKVIETATANQDKHEGPQLLAAFKMVEDRDNWKQPIDAFCRFEDKDIIREAIIHYTGSVPTFNSLGNGWCKVTAAGYYQAVGT